MMADMHGSKESDAERAPKDDKQLAWEDSLTNQVRNRVVAFNYTMMQHCLR